eukprot:3705288-Rhodomonas_salina.2
MALMFPQMETMAPKMALMPPQLEANSSPQRAVLSALHREADLQNRVDRRPPGYIPRRSIGLLVPKHLISEVPPGTSKYPVGLTGTTVLPGIGS